MTTFYLLPPRACLEEAVSGLFGKLLPGLPLPADIWETLVSHLVSVARWPEVVFVPRDELPESELPVALAEAFGAEAGDRVVEVSLARTAREWMIPAGMSGVARAR
ncbi:MAG: hypothetical protein L0241_25170 [Planctomycetia bacterium]|nr:hypothetical protein [Planctomycetia bacterium]